MMGNKSRLGGQEQDPSKRKPGEMKPRPEALGEDDGGKVDGRRDADHPILPNPD